MLAPDQLDDSPLIWSIRLKPDLIFLKIFIKNTKIKINQTTFLESIFIYCIYANYNIKWTA
jgi:hypothetical protein